MSKRVRGSARGHRRPGSRPVDRGAKRRPASGGPGQLRAAEVIAEDIVEKRPAEAAAQIERVARAVPTRPRGKAGSLLATRAATEYLYVAQDMRRILLVAGSLFATLVVLWLLIVVLRLVSLSFY